ncbi:MAG: sigma 54-interacting transcriptional regulator [Desulfotignum sp.]
MGRIDNDITRLFPGVNLSRVSFLPLLKEFFEGVIITDHHGCVLFVNDEQARIDDMPVNMLSGKKITDTYRVDDGDSPVMQCIRTRRPVKGLACYYRTCTGKVVNSIHNVFPLFEENRLLGTICFIQDFSIIEQRFDALSIPGKITDLQGRQTGMKLQHNGANGTRFCFKNIIGSAREFAECVDAARLSSRSVSPVMLFGETGTGKELLAQSIHNHSSRKGSQYVAVNCAAIPENLLEGILFGTTRGAFTGAVDKPGLFEKAHGGTLLLDEINTMTMGLQAKLLRFLQERKIRRVGSLEEHEVDLKIISSVNVNPHVAIAQQTLRADLFYRLAVIFIRIPPLRERSQDLPMLISHFLSKSNALLGRQITAVSEKVLSLFEQYPWPGNVRELEHVIEGSMNLADEKEQQIRPHHLPSHMALFFEQNTPAKTASAGEALFSPWGNRQENERQMVLAALQETAGRPSAAAAKLGISPQLMNYKMKKYGIDRRYYQ